MNKLELSPRLAAIAAQVPQGARLADVGTDHAYLPVCLLLEGIISQAVASDVNEGPLQRGRETARTYGVEEQIAFRCCDGLAGIGPDQADTVAICGMGGELIARILGQAPWTKTALLLLQPMSSQPELRRWLLDNGYLIRQERVVKEGEKYYVILTVTGGENPIPYTPAELWVGRQNPEEDNPHRKAYLADQIRRRERALAGMKQGSVNQEALAREEALLAGLRAMEKEWSAWQR